MAAPLHSSTWFEDAIDVPIWLESDAALPLAERRHRDRAIGKTLPPSKDSGRVRAWWRRLDAPRDELPGRRLERARRLVNLALVVVGLISGTGLALAAFRYDGTYPVNVVRLLGLLVVPQLLLLALNLLLIPGRIGWLRVFQDAVSAINPGALAGQLYRQLARRPESHIFAWAVASTTAARRFAKWQMLYWSQLTAVAFNVGVIATAVALIAFTDIAFGWSTTLDIESETASGIAGAIATPWAALLPESVPDAALVERSRYFRLEGQNVLADSRALTGWWSFTVLAVIVYGFIPRLAFLLLAGLRLRAATCALLLRDSRVTALLDRMSAPDVETQALAHTEPSARGEAQAEGLPLTALSGASIVVTWSQDLTRTKASEYLRRTLGLVAPQIVSAGSGSLEADREALERLAAVPGPVVVLVPAWEPPLLEFVDFIGALRRVIGPAGSIVVVPVGEDLRDATPLERETWSRAVASSGDPHVYVETESA